MKNRKNTNTKEGVPIHNPVAKFAHQFNTAQIFKDKNTYRRNAKHRKQEASLNALVRVIREAFCGLETAIRSQDNSNPLASNAGLMDRVVRHYYCHYVKCSGYTPDCERRKFSERNGLLQWALCDSSKVPV